jgi:cytochrome c
MVPAALGMVALGFGLTQQQAVGAPSGDQLFRQRCAMCHSVDRARTTPLGPNLAGVGGRRAGSTTFAYSPALKASGLTWNAATLDRYLAAPTRVVPGTKMVIAVPNPAERAALVSYLATVK